MADAERYARLDPEQLEVLHRAERPTLRLRWWLVLPLAAALSCLQAYLNIQFEFSGTNTALIASQVSIIAFAFLAILAFVVNPLIRVSRLITPLNRGEMMALFAAMFVSGGIASFGLIDQLVPLIIAPFNPSFNVPQRQWETHIIPHLNQALFITDTDAIRAMRTGFPDDPYIWSRVPDEANIWSRIPWSLWLRPLALWMIFVFAVYAMFYALSSLLYQSWARREKLVFPLARLPEDMLADPGAPAGSLPGILRNRVFWLGFGVAAGILAYNAFVQAGWIRMQPLYLGIFPDTMIKMLDGTVFKGIAENAYIFFSIYFIFIAVGIAFLLPLEISGSIWKYSLLSIGAIMVAIWMAAGSSSRSFPSDWLWDNSFVSALGAGGMLAFAATYLLKAVMERWGFAREWNDERNAKGFFPFLIAFLRAFGWGGVLLVASLAVIVGWLAWSGVPVHWSIIYLSIVILMTVGLMRVVAEGGMYWFQLHTGPFHLAKMAGMAGDPAMAGPFAKLMPIHSVLFLETKDYLAPAVLNSFKMQDETRAAKRMFHLAVLLAIVVTVAASVVVILMLGYKTGVDRGNRWFWTKGPRGLLEQATRLISGEGIDTPAWVPVLYVIGAAWVIASFLMRRRFFWWAHPIGFAMIANPLASHLWFSFFLGWLFKKLTVKYGGRHMYARVRPFFIGLILGEVLSCFFWSIIANVFRLNIRIDINRYNAHPY
jgi:hypothetical protein